LYDLPVGVHEVRLQEVWDTTDSPVSATLRILVNPDRGRYRLLLTGLEVVRQADDDILGLDGRGNEVMATAVTLTSVPGQREPIVGFARTKLLGDVRGFPDRIQAGTASPQGGLRTGDVVPQNARLPQLRVAATQDRFPLLLWEGELAETGPRVAVVPILFEWSAAAQYAWSSWANTWAVGSRPLEFLAYAAYRVQAFHPTDPVRIQDFAEVLESADRHLVRRRFSAQPNEERPIGLKRPAWVSEGEYPPRGFLLTFAAVERSLGPQAALMLSIPWADDISGHYVGHFQLERLSPPPPQMPEPPPLAPAAK
jgi:hypothetical protein